MGTTSDKLTYLNGTKQALKDSINNIGGDITSETTFRNYVTELDNIYDNLPKTTGEGTNLSLTTLKGRINVDDILGDTTQEGTPTPSSPQDINVVTGEQQVLVRGKNLFDGILELGLINGNTGLDQPNSTIIRDKNYIQVEGNTQYVISTPNSTIASDSVLIYEYKADYSYNLTTNIGVAFGTAWTTKADTKYIRFRPRYATTDTTIKFMVEKGTTASAWQPYQEQTKIVNLSSKNILNITSLQQGIIGTTTLTYENDILTLKSGAYGSSFANLETKTLKANTQYIYELFLTETSTNSAKVSLIVQKEGNTNIINSGQITFGDQTYYSFTYTPTEDTKILRLQFYNSSTTPITADISFKVQLREASSESGYMPYYNYELCKIGTYQDRISKSSGKNLFDKDNANIIDNAYIGSTNIASINGAKTLYIECEPNTTYTISRTAGKRFVVATTIYEPQLNTSIGGRIVDNEASSITITTNSVAKYLCVFYYLSGTDTLSEETIRNSIMINEGSTALPYEPYGTNWYIEKNIGKKVLNGSESWNFSTYGTKYRASISVSDIYTSQADNTISQLYSNYFLKGAYDVANENTVTARYNNPQLNFFITLATSKTEWTTWLSTHNTSVTYPLETPTDIEITNTNLINELNELEKMMSYNGTTNINISGNLPMLVGVSALKGEPE